MGGTTGLYPLKTLTVTEAKEFAGLSLSKKNMLQVLIAIPCDIIPCLM